LIATESPRFDFGALGKVPGIKAGALISNPGPDMVNGKPTMHHHHDCGSDARFLHSLLFCLVSNEIPRFSSFTIMARSRGHPWRLMIRI
jgi:hypothetical protein